MTIAEEVASSVETTQQVDPTPTQMESSKPSFEAAIEKEPKVAEPAIGTVPEGAERPEETIENPPEAAEEEAPEVKDLPIEKVSPEEIPPEENPPEAQPTTEAAEEEAPEVKDLPIEKVSLEEIPPATESKENEPGVEMKKETEAAVDDQATLVSPKEEPIVIDSAEVVKAPPPETVPEAETAPPQTETPNASE